MNTLLTVYLHPDNEDHARYLIEEETLVPGCIFYTVISKPEERLPLDMAPFTISHREKQVMFTLNRPLTPTQIEAMTSHVTIGLIYGFAVKGEINLGETIINNLEG